MSGAIVDTVGNETETSLAYLRQQRETFRFIVHGLTKEQLRSTPTQSEMSLEWLLTHIATVENNFAQLIATGTGDAIMASLTAEKKEEERDVDTLLDAITALGATTDDLVREKGLDHEVPIPPEVPWFPKNRTHWNVRWVVNHLIEEYARHAGHADMLREAIDGKTMFELQSMVEGWHEQYLAWTGN
ncbi:DinB family protein [Haloglycomyces albus]|uniref:DinB family protein n=1 Tax=Haloglycomyces albus TaxID=526067 RepID=UPI00046CD074|nr:DinB family protein [Haloglycomyces albus]